MDDREIRLDPHAYGIVLGIVLGVGAWALILRLVIAISGPLW